MDRHDQIYERRKDTAKRNLSRLPSAAIEPSLLAHGTGHRGDNKFIYHSLLS